MGLKFCAVSVRRADREITEMKVYGPFRSAADASNFVNQSPPTINTWFVRTMIEEAPPQETKEQR
jgi:hypothetical protein